MSLVVATLTAAAFVAIAAQRAPRPRRQRTRPSQSGRVCLPLAEITALTLLVGSVVASELVTVVLVVWVAVDRRRPARAHRVRTRAVAEALPDAVDLLALCTSAGQSLALAHPQVARLVPGPLGSALLHAERQAAVGRPRADALHEALVDLGDRAPSLAHALSDHLRYGTPLAATLDRLGTELRLDRRRRAEEAVRRVPVRLLTPLLICVLPAFGLLTVVPLLASSLRSLSL